jgi:hypothetical protein
MQQFCNFQETIWEKVWPNSCQKQKIIKNDQNYVWFISKTIIVLIISEDLAFWTRSLPHFLGLKLDKMASNHFLNPFLIESIAADVASDSPATWSMMCFM